jgi:hypothetical protein
VLEIGILRRDRDQETEFFSGEYHASAYFNEAKAARRLIIRGRP